MGPTSLLAFESGAVVFEFPFAFIQSELILWDDKRIISARLSTPPRWWMALKIVLYSLPKKFVKIEKTSFRFLFNEVFLIPFYIEIAKIEMVVLKLLFQVLLARYSIYSSLVHFPLRNAEMKM